LDIKEASRLLWSVKRMLIPDDWTNEDIYNMVERYTKRVWYNHEANDDGFEEAWEKKHDNTDISGLRRTKV